MTRHQLILLASAGSAALLLGAFGFQYLANMPPCALCLWQRWPHAAAVILGLLALMLRLRALPLLGAVAMLICAGIGLYHTGVERKWWQGPSTCTSGDISGLSAEQLMEQIMTAPIVRCDEVPWELFTLSMASWNMLASLVLAAIWLRAATR